MFRYNKLTSPAFFLSLSASLISTASLATSITTVNGTLGPNVGGITQGTHSQFTGINNSGRVVGYSNTLGNVSEFPKAFSGSASESIYYMGSIEKYSPTNYTYFDTARGINDSGQVVGEVQLPPTNQYHAYRTSPNGLISGSTDLGSWGGTLVTANAINNAGQVVGSASYANGTIHAYRTTANGLIEAGSDLGSLGGHSYAYSINESGQVAGDSRSPSSGTSTHAFRTTPNGLINSSSDLGTLGGSSSHAADINALGQVVGESQIANGKTHAFRTTADGSITSESDLGTLGGTQSAAYSINSLGQTVGLSTLANDTVIRPFFADTNGQMVDLNTLLPPGSGWFLGSAWAINDLGQIAGHGSYNNGANVSFYILTLPEPSLISILGLGILFLNQRHRTR